MTDHFSNLNYKDEDTERLINGYFAKKREKERAEKERLEKEEKERLEREAQEIANNEKKGSKLEKKAEEESQIILPTNIVSSDYIQIPGKDYIIAIGETDFNLDYENANRTVLTKGLAVPTIRQFMDFHNYLIDCYKNNKPIFDSAGNNLPDKIKKDLYKQLTSHCWTWLNGKFNISEKKKEIEIITGLDSNKNLLTRKEQLNNFLNEDCYVNFNDFYKNGIPNINSKYANQNFVKGENIYYWSPIDERVARFYADSDGAGLGCGRNPSYVDSFLGVRAVRHGAGLLAGGQTK